jgi:hypothetical protein
VHVRRDSRKPVVPSVKDYELASIRNYYRIAEQDCQIYVVLDLFMSSTVKNPCKPGMGCTAITAAVAIVRIAEWGLTISRLRARLMVPFVKVKRGN